MPYNTKGMQMFEKKLIKEWQAHRWSLYDNLAEALIGLTDYGF